MLGDWYCSTCLTSFAGEPERCPNLACRSRMPHGGWSPLLRSGEILDRFYEVQELLAVGGAGVTYRARELDAHDRAQPPDLAIKVLHVTRSSGPFLQRLANEAQILQGLRNDHIVECLGFVQRQGAAPYLVTRYLPGGTLEDFIEESGALPPWTVAGIIRQVLEGLALAHSRGIVHRDLKPANVLLGSRGSKTEIPHVRVADFGIAKVSGGPGSGLTRAGFFIGTPQYAAPEQFLGQEAKAETDVFATGALALYLLTGSPHFDPPDGGDMAEYHSRVLESLPPKLPSSIMRSRKGALIHRFLVGAMQAEPAQRWTLARCMGWLDYVLDVRNKPPAPEPSPARPAPGETAVFDRQVVLRAEGQQGEGIVGVGEAVGRVPGPAATTDPSPRREQGPTGTPHEGYELAEVVHARATLPASGPTAVPPDFTRESAAPPPAAPPRPERPALREVPRPLPAPVQRASVPDRSTDPGQVPGPRGQVAAWRRQAALDADGGALEVLVEEEHPGDSRVDSPEVPFTTPKAGGFRVSYGDAVPWRPEPPVALPTTLPRSAPDLLGLLGAVSAHDRRAVLNALHKLPANQLHKAVVDHGPGRSAVVGRGVGLLVVDSPTHGWTAVVRSLLSDSDPGVRCTAQLGLARAAPAAALKTLATMLQDDHQQVRVIAVRALVDAGRLCSKGSLAAYMLRPHRQDSDPAVQTAVELALMDLQQA